LQNPCHIDALVDIQVGTDLIEEVKVRIASGGSRNGDALQLSSAQAGYLSVDKPG